MSKYSFNPEKYIEELRSILTDLTAILKDGKLKPKDIDRVLKRYPKDQSKIFSRDQLIAGARWLKKENLISIDFELLINSIKLKPTRTISGVTTVTVLTMPWGCPGKCIFCPNDIRMPKSYIANEPGAQRALANRFNPYLQVFNRLQALKNIGHPTEKVELLVLGGSWSVYPEKYQVWFISECFRALNDFGLSSSELSTILTSKSLKRDTTTGFVTYLSNLDLEKLLPESVNSSIRKGQGEATYNKLIQNGDYKNRLSQIISDEYKGIDLAKAWDELEGIHEFNSKSGSRCIGLVLETRPDLITKTEVVRLRRLGATKIQLGIQTLDDTVSKLNKRGEGRKETGRAFNLLRAGGFKIHAHMMPNLLGATVKTDLKSYKNLFVLSDYKPDEVKIYPTSVIKNTELFRIYEKGGYNPYETAELIDLVADMLEMTPEYCRITRVIRDIPSTEINAGNKKTNLRQLVEAKLKNEDRANNNIRAREVKSRSLDSSDLRLNTIKYATTNSTEYFLQYITKKNKIAGFLRLSIPASHDNSIIKELDNCAIIREIHVYGPSLEISKESSGQAQHLGLGTKLISQAKSLAVGNGFKQLAVISGIGTREYYKSRGFKLNKLYQVSTL